MKKRGRFTVKQLKALLYDFYDSETIAVAKNVLLDAVNELKVDGGPKITRKRRDSKENPEAKIRGDIDDLILLVTFADEINVMERLPIYVAADPDLVPSMRLMEGDLLVLINKLDKIDERCRSLQTDLEITRSLTQMRLSGATSAKQGSNIKHSANVHFQKGHLAVTDSEGVSSARESDCEMAANDAELFITPRTKSDVKRSNTVKKRARESPTAPLFSEIAAKVPSKVVMLGHAVNSSLKAS